VRLSPHATRATPSGEIDVPAPATASIVNGPSSENAAWMTWLDLTLSKV
jgi:hypothetical protein